MNRPKKAAKQDRGKAAAPPGKKRRHWVWVVLALTVCAGLLFWRQGRAQRLFDEAQAQFKTDPQQAERLLEQSVAAAGGNFPQAQLLRCRALGATSRWDEALGLFSLIEDATQCEQAELLRLAQEAERAGVEALALRALGAADRTGPNEAAVLRRLIRLELKAGSQADVLEQCRRLEPLAPDDPTPWRLEGQILQQRKESLAAVRAYREALRRNPDEQQELAIRVELVGPLIDAGELAAARQEMDRLLAHPAAAEGVRMKDANLLRLEGRTREALAQIDRVLAKSPGLAGALMLRGMLYFDLGRYAEAAADLARVAAAEPNNKEARYKLGQAYLKLNRPAEAEQQLAASQRLTDAEIEILQLQPRLRQNLADRALIERLAKLYDEVGRNEDAERLRRSASNE